MMSMTVDVVKRHYVIPSSIQTDLAHLRRTTTSFRKLDPRVWDQTSTFPRYRARSCSVSEADDVWHLWSTFGDDACDTEKIPSSDECTVIDRFTALACPNTASSNYKTARRSYLWQSLHTPFCWFLPFISTVRQESRITRNRSIWGMAIRLKCMLR